MRTLRLLATALLSAGACVAKATTNRYSDFAAKSQPVSLGDQSFTKLLQAPRDYAVAVLFTALKPQFGCKVCQDFAPDWNLLAKTWTKDTSTDAKLIFGTLDFTNGKNTFQLMGLQTAPVLMLFPPTVGPHAKDDPAPAQYSFSSSEIPTEAIHAWIGRQLPGYPVPKFIRPVNYAKIGFLAFTIVGGLILVVVAWPLILPLIQNRNLWAAVSLIAVLLFTSGHMFNHIRKVPYVSGDGKGGVAYFAGGFQNQFGLETQIIAAIYGILSFSAISLALKVPRISDPQTQTLAVFIWSGVIFLVYSFLLSVFKLKNGGYPFWLPPF